MTDTYKAGQRLEAKYNGHVVTITHVDPDGGIRVTDTQGRTGISTAESPLRSGWADACPLPLLYAVRWDAEVGVPRIDGQRNSREMHR